MVEETQYTATVKEETMEEQEEAPADIESQVKNAMRFRVNHFKEQADSLTFEGVRRLLEKDLGLEKFALDVHKRFVKQCLLECLEGAADDNVSKDSGEAGDKDVLSVKTEETASHEGHEPKKNVKEGGSEDEEKMEDSPVMGLLTGKKTNKSETARIKVNDNKDAPSESSIKKALLKRASYIKANSEKLTAAGLRQLLEEDLKLNKNALEPFKKFINKQLDEVMKSHEVSTQKEKNLKKTSFSKSSKKSSSEDSDSLDKENDEEDEEVEPRKKVVQKPKMLNNEGSKKRKRPEKVTKVSGKKQVKHAGKVEENNSDAEDSVNTSEDSHSQLSPEKSVKKKEASTPSYGKRVEHLRSVIKSCGMSVPPAVYKKIKQVPENKREAQLMKELEEILSREGLSLNPSEKEIKEVRKRKERAKELEGIDMSNIVSSSRRRSTASYATPPKPKVPVENEGDDADNTDEEDEDEDDDDDDDDEEEEENEDDDDGDNDGDDESQSEESDEGHEESN